MMSGRRLSGTLFVVALLVLPGFTGCKQPRASAAVPPNPAPASATPPVPAAPVKEVTDGAPKPRAWTDPPIVAGFSRDCDYVPEGLDQPQNPQDVSPLSCTLEFDQSCVYDPCFNKGEDCKPMCVQTCGSCQKGCAGSCKSCKQKCKDDACIRACATGCGTCRQACLVTRDHCATGTCAQVARECRSTLRADWLKNGCPRICKAYGPCLSRCVHKNEKADDAFAMCQQRCAPRLPPSCDLGLCPGEFGMGIDPLQKD